MSEQKPGGHPGRPNSTLHPYAGRFPVNRTMPDHGVARSEILDIVAQMQKEEDAKADNGRVSGSIYSGDHEHYAFLTEAFGHFAHANVMQRDMYPSATKMESEIIAMTRDMLHGDADTGGLNTSGGTESLVTAMLAYREWGRNEKGIEHPQIIMPVTGHPAMSKAFHWFDIEPVIAPVTDDFTVDLDFVRDHITDRTVALIGTAGTYPHGLIDPIPSLGELALEHGIGLHVDGCLGGFILAWARDCGYEHTSFDLAVPGVTSISADTHKYGYALKGSSVVLFQPKSLRRQVYSVVKGWPGGMYSSPSMGGSRSGGLIASTWASMLELRQGRLPAHRRRHLPHGGGVEGGGAVARGAGVDRRRPVQRRLPGQPVARAGDRHLPRQRFAGGLRLADERPAAPAGAALLRHPTEHPGRRGRGVRH